MHYRPTIIDMLQWGDEKLFLIKKYIKGVDFEQKSFVYCLVPTDLVDHQR